MPNCVSHWDRSSGCLSRPPLGMLALFFGAHTKKDRLFPIFFFPSELLNDPSRVEEEKVGLQEEKIALTLHHEETWGAGKMLKKFEY